MPIVLAAKEPGNPCASAQPGRVACGDPIDIGSGNLFEQVTDYETDGQNKLAFIRSYNALKNASTFAKTLGARWRSNYDRYLNIVSSSAVIAERADGQQVNFTLVGSIWTPDSDVSLMLTHTGTTWTLTDVNDTTETYAASGSQASLTAITLRNGYTQTLTYTSGLLTTVTDSYSRSLVLTYSSGLLATVTTPESLVLTYGYNSSGFTTGVNDRLISVSYNTSPATSQTYTYNVPELPFALTGITDENGNNFASWSYDGQSRALSSQHAGGADLTQIAYDDATGNRTVTDPLGQTTTYIFTTDHGVPKVSQMSSVRATGSSTAATRNFTYDSNGFPATTTDWNGNSTHYTMNAQGQPTQIIEAYGSTVARTTAITYDTTWTHLPHIIETGTLKTTLNYFTASGNLQTKVLHDKTTAAYPDRTYSFTWTSTGQLLTSSMPTRSSDSLTPSTTYTYDASALGNLKTVKDALNHGLTISTATAGGRPLTVTDDNGVVTTLTYDARLRLHTSALTVSGTLRTTTWDHDAAGNTTKLTQPDGSYLIYGYDNAHRLTSITNALNEAMLLTLDAAGDVTKTLWQNASASTKRELDATFDALGRKTQDKGGSATHPTTNYAYDAQSNLTGITDPKGHAGSQAFDALNRLSTITDRASHNASYNLDEYDRPTSLTDFNGHATTYGYNGFGDLIQQVSPDTGTTSFTYDEDGNVRSKTDASSATTNFTYDAANRPLTRTYVGGSALNVAMTYDQTGHGKGLGRLTSVTDQSGSLSVSYDERGSITTNARTISSTLYTTSYTFDGANRVATVTYPGSGWIVTYNRDAAGQVSSVTSTHGGTTTNLATSVKHMPFGPVTSFFSGNGVANSETFDLDYRPVIMSVTGAALLSKLTYAYDDNSNVTSITDGVTSANSQTLTPDILDRLLTASSTGTYGSLSYTYDNNGNRTAAGTTSYTISPTSNRLASYTPSGGSTVNFGYTSTGNILSFGTASLTYNKANQQATASFGGASGTYGYDAFGQRVTVTVPGMPLQVYQYDRDGHLLTETNNSVETDYVYLDGMPLAVIQPAAATIAYLHDDRLGTPILGTDASKANIWTRHNEPFGAGMPSGTLVTQSLRLPGQQADNTGFFHNGFRDYNPAFGRYLKPDPMGLTGGWNTYAYAYSNPARWSDPSGLFTQYGVSGGGTLGVGVGGVSGGATVFVSVPENWRRFGDYQLAFSAQAAGEVGFGLYGGIGVQLVAAQSSSPVPLLKASRSWLGEGDIAVGPLSVGATVGGDLKLCQSQPWFENLGPVNNLGAPAPRIGFGAGAWIGAGPAGTVTFGIPSLNTLWNSVSAQFK